MYFVYEIHLKDAGGGSILIPGKILKKKKGIFFNMEYSHLLSFLAVAEELHFAKAAERLKISQPQLSRRIRALEESVNTRLFSRSNKWNVELTAAGRVFLPEVKNLLFTMEKARNSVRSAGEGKTGTLSVGAISSMLGQDRFIEALQKMRSRYPGVRIHVTDSTSARLCELLADRSVDLALMRPLMGNEDGAFCEKLLFHDKLLLAMSRKHPLAKKESFPVSALSGERFILVPERNAKVYRNYITAFCHKYGGFLPDVRHEISSSYTALRLASAGLGVTIVSESYEGTFGDNLSYRRFSDFEPVLPIVASYLPENDSPVLRNFLHLLSGVFRKER